MSTNDVLYCLACWSLVVGLCLKHILIGAKYYNGITQLLASVVHAFAIYGSMTSIYALFWYFEGSMSSPLHHCIMISSSMLNKSEKIYLPQFYLAGLCTWQKKVSVLRLYVGTWIFIGTSVAAGIYARRFKFVRPYPYYARARMYSQSAKARSTKVYLPQK